jgi:hypothetical protein
MKKNKIIGTVAVVAIATMFALNINYALEGYGIKSISLHPEVIAQTNGTGGSTTGGGTTGGNTSGGNTSGGDTSGGDTSGGDTSGGNTSGGNSTLWKRADGDCEYNFKGKANAEITIFGVVTIKLNGKGEATYTAKNGMTDCTSNGQQQCTARYCPVVPQPI